MPFSYALTWIDASRFGFQSHIASSMQCYIHINTPGFPAAPITFCIVVCEDRCVVSEPELSVSS